MNREESIKLLALIKVAYPSAYKDMDTASKQATVNMWHNTFPKVPYQIMELAFNRYRLVSKFPPTVADMVESLKGVYYQALEGAELTRMFGTQEELNAYLAIMDHTEPYKSGRYLDAPLVGSFKELKSATAGMLTEGVEGV
jgi:hypothetical protein